jgi:hypothetical protein
VVLKYPRGFKVIPLPSGNVLDGPGSSYTTASFKLDVSTKDSYDAYSWWLANLDYNSRTTLWIYSVNGWVRKVVGQRTNGGR